MERGHRFRGASYESGDDGAARGTAGRGAGAGTPGRRTLTEQLPARLPDALRARAERSFGVDFSDVRLHESAEVEAANALAYTRNGDIYFRPGGYDPDSERFIELLGHELTHVVQQREGRVAATQAKAGPGGQPANVDASLEAEADEGGRRLVRGERFAVSARSAGGGGPAAPGPITQLKLTRYDDLKTSGNGFDWGPHRTQDTKTGATDETRVAFGLGAGVKNTQSLEIAWGGKVTSKLDAATREPASLEWQLHPRVEPGPAPDSGRWARVRTLMIAADPKKRAFPYEASMLVPDGLGGDDAKDNVVALPKESHGALGEIHQWLYRLVGEQNACVLFRVTVTHADDPAGAKQRYAKTIRCEWHEIDPKGAMVASTQGERTINVRSPTEIANKQHGSVDTPPNIGGALGPANRATVPASGIDRAAGTAVSWQTEIEWSPTNDEGDGVKMEARKLGPDHKMGEEPKSGAGLVWADRVKQMKALSAPKKKYIAGHLLNHQLGGPGNDARNLAPIPSDSNTKFAQDVESAVKNIVNVQHGWVYYSVEVTHTQVPTSKKATKATPATTYPSSIRAQWWQLDELGGEVANTRGDVTMDLDPPTKGGGYTMTPTVDAGAGSRQAGTAETSIAFQELILDNDPAILRPKILIMRPLVRSLEELQLHGYFQDEDLLASAEEIVNGFAPSPTELAAYKDLAAFSTELATAASPMDVKPKRMDEIEKSLAAVINERGLRTTHALLAAQLFYQRRFGDTRAKEIHDALSQTMKRSHEDIEKLQRLGLDMLAYAKSLHGIAHDMQGKLTTSANKFRAWLGLPEIDPQTTTGDDAEQEIAARSKEVVDNVYDIYATPGSPLQIVTYGQQEGLTTVDNAHDMRLALGKQAADPQLGRNKQPAYGSVPPSKLGAKMLEILDDDAKRATLVKLGWTGGPNEAAKTVRNLAQMIEASKPLGIDYLSVATHAIRALYENHTIPFERYYRWLEPQL